MWSASEGRGKTANLPIVLGNGDVSHDCSLMAITGQKVSLLAREAGMSNYIAREEARTARIEEISAGSRTDSWPEVHFSNQ